MRAIRRRSSRSKARPGRDQRNRAPGAAAPPDRSDQHVALNRRMGVADVARQHAQVPVGLLRQREEEVGFRAAGAERGDAAVSRPGRTRACRGARAAAPCAARGRLSDERTGRR